MNKLHLTKHSFTLRFSKPARLPPFVGNTVRGALGQSLCDNYHDIYEKIFKHESQSRESAPNPFVISTPYPGTGNYHAGDELKFSITLFGDACRYEDSVLSAVGKMCKGKLSDAQLISSEPVYSRQWNDEGAETIARCEELTIEFLSPSEILHKKQPVFEPDFDTLIKSLFGRIRGIIDTYTDSEFTLPYALAIAKPRVDAEYDLKIVRFQTNKQPINAFLGTVHYIGDVTRYLPYIDLGSQIHIGKKTTRSCGEFIFSIS